MSTNDYVKIKFDDIVVEDRFRKNTGSVSSLVESIKKDGLLHPLAVKLNSDGTYRLLAGGRRYQALKFINEPMFNKDPNFVRPFEDVPVKIYNEELTIDEQLSIELNENLCRLDMSWQEEVALKKRIHDLLMKKHGPKTSTRTDLPNHDSSGHSKVDTAKLLGDNVSWFYEDMKIADAMEKMPKIAEMATKKEAVLFIKNIARRVDVQNKADKIEAELKDETYPERVKRILNGYVVGDFFEEGQDLITKSYDLIEVDPPYAINFKDGDFGSNHSKEDYNEIPTEEYLEFLGKTAKLCYQLGKENSWCIFWFGFQWRELVREILQAVGYKVPEIPAVWTKTIGITSAPMYNLGSAWECFYYARKGTPELVCPGKINVFRSEGSKQRIHPTERPVDLIFDIITTFIKPGSKILVPFLGSGNTLVAADVAKCSAVGFELSEAYKKAFMVKLVGNSRMPVKAKE